MRTLIIFFTSCLLFLFISFLGQTDVLAQTCQCDSWNCTFELDPDTGGTSQFCSCATQTGSCGQGCPPNFYASNNGCTEIGGGVACGEWYECPTPSNPDKMCKNSCGGGSGSNACRPVDVDCPPGTVINLANPIDSFCKYIEDQLGACTPGSAQRENGSEGICCTPSLYKPEINENCDRSITNPSKCFQCLNNRITTYGCVSTCNATAASGVSAVQGASATVANLSWTVGSNGVSQNLYVDEDLVEVSAGCTTPNDCVVIEKGKSSIVKEVDRRL